MLRYFWAFLICALLGNPSYAGATKTVVALSPHSVEMLFSIGAGKQIIGTVQFADYPAQALKIPRIGSFSGIQIERVATLQPDLILAWKGGNPANDLKKLESLGFNILYSHPKNMQEVGDDLLTIGRALGLSKNAELVKNSLMNAYQDIKNKYANKPKVSVFYQLWHDPLRTIGQQGWIASLIKDCGGENIFGHAQGAAAPIISLESVLVKNPQVIIVPTHSGSQNNQTKYWGKWLNLKAVQQNHVYRVDGDLLHRFSPRAVKGLASLCEYIDRAR